MYVPSTSNCSSSRTESRRGGGSGRPKCNHLANGRLSSSLPQQNSSSYSKHSTESLSIWPSTIDRFWGWPAVRPGLKTPLDNEQCLITTAHHHTWRRTLYRDSPTLGWDFFFLMIDLKTESDDTTFILPKS